MDAYVWTPLGRILPSMDIPLVKFGTHQIKCMKLPLKVKNTRNSLKLSKSILFGEVEFNIPSVRGTFPPQVNYRCNRQILLYDLLKLL